MQMYMSNPLPAIPSKDAVRYRLYVGESTSLAMEHEIRDEERRRKKSDS